MSFWRRWTFSRKVARTPAVVARLLTQGTKVSVAPIDASRLGVDPLPMTATCLIALGINFRFEEINLWSFSVAGMAERYHLFSHLCIHLEAIKAFHDLAG